jgi:hypothetical protein
MDIWDIRDIDEYGMVWIYHYNYSTILVGGDWNMTRLYPYAPCMAYLLTFAPKITQM